MENKSFFPAERYSSVFYMEADEWNSPSGLQSQSARHDGDQETAAVLKDDWHENKLVTT